MLQRTKESFVMRSGERAWEWGMGCLVKCISPHGDGKVGSHITLGFCSTFGQTNSSGTSSGGRQVSQGTDISFSFKVVLQSVCNWFSGAPLLLATDNPLL